ncbi:Copper homeostasis protein CutC [Pseudoalteromonas sp. CIP111854]|uniref:Copper homeostasis protein cutC homolog n=1 Tax=Pseudoalteromonas holothuriae TaxID=2963714 RepID=A0A9W4QRY2_9GAMM|nr:copper homeostasis protein CutC [Pseudoalteromonas sp. CIP111854]CAH9050520.1 Copper homeostasis protein CutC [Pseudoalteromonas sp. CIP111854]
MNPAMNLGKKLEICLSSDDLNLLKRNTHTTFASGATRIELCSALHLGGLCPSSAAIQCVARQLPSFGECIVMLRSDSHFFIDGSMLYQLQLDLQRIAADGATGIALGFVDKYGNIAEHASKQLILTAKSLGLTVTFHRAFDALKHWQRATDTLIALDVTRVLSAGSCWQSGQSAYQNQAQLARLLTQLNGQIEVVIGGGVCTQSAEALWHLSEFGAMSLHTHSGVHNTNGEVCPTKVQTILAKN